MKSSWIVVVSAALLCTAGSLPPISAAPDDAPTPADETEVARQDESAEGAAGNKKFQNGLYVEVGFGTASVDPLDTTVITSSQQVAINTFELTEMDYRRAAVGWRVPEGKGNFRLRWEGFNETSYSFSSIGRGALESNPDGGDATKNYDRWLLVVGRARGQGELADLLDVDRAQGNGDLTVVSALPSWTAADDADMDGEVDQDEVTYPAGIRFSNAIQIEPDLQNRVHLVDLLYGREFGPRRVKGTWWGGLRYFAYEGTILQGAWLRPVGTDDGFTDGALLRLIHSEQKATAFGPTGSLGFKVNFFDERFQIFMAGQFAFTLSDIEVDTGDFFTLTSGDNVTVSAPARLQATRSRTSWHTHVEAGLRLSLKLGLVLELAYYDGSFLDAVITPSEILIPQSSINAQNGTSAFYTTQDLRFDGWRGSVGFQF